ncbi:MAG: hypothetical protein WCJ35_15485 [Planctomycetota bacterium]
MNWTNLRRVMITCCATAVLLGAPRHGWAECALWNWLFGNGQTTYAAPYCPPNVYVPTALACGCAPTQCAPTQCAPAQPACQSCTPTATYRISYRPVPTVAYMPVVGIDPCSGCAVTTYRPTRAWTYQASLLPYSTFRVGYAPVGFGSCGSCAPNNGYSASYGGCVPRGMGGCSSCNTGVSSGYVPSNGCSSCASSPVPLSGTPLPRPSDMSQPPVASPPLTAPSLPATIGPPTAAPLTPGSSLEVPKTYGPGATSAPISPSAPGAGTSSGTFYRGPVSNEGSSGVEPLRIQNIPPISNGPQLSPSPNARPEKENRTTSRHVLQATYFQLLQSPPASVPAQMIATPVRTTPQPVDDSGWQHADH